MKKVIRQIISITILVSAFSSTYAQDCYTLVWSDEFDGTAIDQTKWNYENGTGYPILTDWGNSENQFYSNDANNIEVSNGSLKIRAQAETLGNKSYTSGRIRSKGNFDFKYGRIEAKIKIPKGNGLWPALWLLPSENIYGAWPKSGEIDIMENFGQDDHVGSTIHFKDGNNTNQWNSQSYATTHNEYHIFSAVWDKDYISFFSDWNWIGEEAPADLRGGTWPFNENFYLILNLALGGNAGTINGTSFPQTMEIDYVRVYQKTEHIDIQGPAQVYPNQTVSYTLPANSTAIYNWTIPTGASILAGQGSNKITVKWGTSAGNISCNSSNWNGDISGQKNTCPAAIHSKAISTITKSCDLTLLNFDGIQQLVPHTEDGVGGIESMYEKNISKTAPNTSALVGRFARTGGQQYDVLKLDFTSPIDASDLKSELNKFKMDVYATSGSAIPMTVEFVNRSKNTGYPNGIYSQHTASISSSNAWQSLTFNYVNTPDWSVGANEVDGINIYFNPNSNTTSTYYFDNLRTTAPITGAITGETNILTTYNKNPVQYSITPSLGASYAWTFGDQTNLISGQGTDKLNVYFNNGIYSNDINLTLTNSMACPYEYTLKVSVSSPTALDDYFGNQIAVYPNPATDLVNISSTYDDLVRFELLNSSGVSVKNGSLEKTETIDFSEFNTGVYFLTVYKENDSKTYKIVKE